MNPSADPDAGSQIWDMYKAGTRLFTKERLAYAEAQLAQKPGYLFLAGIDGRDCVVHTGLGDRRSSDKSGPLDLNGIKAKFEENEEKWLASSECRSLEDTFSKMPIPEKVTKIILDGVRGFIEVDSTSLVFTASPNCPVKQVITDLASPAVIVYGRFDNPESPRTRDMIRDEYDTYPFPDDGVHLHDLEIHVKKT
ncbi:hypothetical protein CSOJ01_11105 [Colletotrichum sojae]|uniref:Uncharacterized protein n=1 Tax=Colletotrichum sojae TaxID=2175907 RepID=A0A8H6MNI4_9PEZI|nr:hypothetical protein CSOJ01_11105 [Colletotrichum sojae]